MILFLFGRMFLEKQFLGVIKNIEGYKLVRIINNDFYFYSKEMLKLVIYNKDLRSIREINFKEGDCPECIKIRFNNIYINDKNIIVSSQIQKKIVFYNLEGLFLKSISTKNMPNFAFFYKEKIITLESAGNKNYIVVYDSRYNFLYEKEIPQSNFSRKYSVAENPLTVCFNQHKLYIPETYRFGVLEYDIENNTIKSLIKSKSLFKNPIIKKRERSTGVIILSAVNNILVKDSLIFIYTIGTKYNNTLLVYNEKGKRILFLKNLKYDDVLSDGRNIYAILSDSIYMLNLIQK